jgi:tripartite-type tricarboxylate transporter receptor subunit TctC
MRAHFRTATIVGVLAVLAPQPSGAADFFAGKTITISTYGAAGDSYDAYMRLLSRHYGRHIPGNPRFTPINQTGAGGLVAMNHAGLVAPQDGTFLTVASQALLIFEATGQRGLQTSIGNFKWLQDAIANEVTVGASGAAGGSMIGPAIYNAVLGTRFKIVYGYQGGVFIDLAMKRGEVEGRGNNTWAGYKATMPNEIRDGKLNVLIQTGLRKDRDLPDVPLFLDLVKGDPRGEPVAQFMSKAVAIARPVAAPPGVPADRVEILRRAFDATMTDPVFLAEAARLGTEIDPLTGEQVQDIVMTVLATPKPVINQIQKTLGLPLN